MPRPRRAILGIVTDGDHDAAECMDDVIEVPAATR